MVGRLGGFNGMNLQVGRPALFPLLTTGSAGAACIVLSLPSMHAGSTATAAVGVALSAAS